MNVLLGLEVGVDEGLGIDAHVLKEARNTSKRLVKVLPLSKGLRNGLENLFILLRLRLVNLLDGLNVLLDVDDGVFPGLESLGEEPGSLPKRIQSVLVIHDQY